MYNFNQPNILMNFFLEDRGEFLFIYSDSNGLKHLEKFLKNDIYLGNLLAPKEVYEKLSENISYNYSCNSLNGIEYCEWTGKRVWISPQEKYDFIENFDKWSSQLEKLLGKENIHSVYIPMNIVKEFKSDANEYDDRNREFMNFLDLYRLKSNLEENLENNNKLQKKKKI